MMFILWFFPFFDSFPVFLFRLTELSKLVIVFILCVKNIVKQIPT